MALRLAQGLRNGMLSGGSVKSLLDGGNMRLYTGAQPATPESTETGTLLITIGATTGGTGGMTWGTASSGGLSKNHGQWSGTCSVAGVAGWFRCYNDKVFTGTDAAGTAARFDGDIGSVTGDLRLSATTLTVDVPVILDTAVFNIAMNQS